jgi:hypothetical protein
VKFENLPVLLDPLAVRRLRDQWDFALEAPAEQHLFRRRKPVLDGN